MFAVETLEPEMLEQLPGFRRRLEWFVENRKDLTNNVACLLSIAGASNCTESRSDYGIRAVSRHHRDEPFVWHVNGGEHRVDYEPGESSTTATSATASTSSVPPGTEIGLHPKQSPRSSPAV